MKAENYIVSLTAFETALIALVLVGVTAIASMGTGFYFGARLAAAGVVDHTNEVLELCNKVVAHEDDRVSAWKANGESCRNEVKRYRTWLTDVEDATKLRATVTHPKRTNRGGQ